MYDLTFNNETYFSHSASLSKDEAINSESHVHDGFQLLYFVKGDVEFTVEQHTRHLEAGDFVLVAPGKYHHVRINPDVEFERYYFRFPINRAREQLHLLLNEKEPFFTNCQKIGLLTSYFDDYAEKYEGVVLESLFASELLKILALLCHTANNSPQIGTALVDQAIKYINLNLTSQIRLEDVAKHCKVSKVLLSIAFKEAVGITIMHYVAVKKALATNQAILNGMKKGEAAKKYGYRDYSTYYRGYQKLKQMDINTILKENL